MFKVYKNMSHKIIAHNFYIWQNNYNLKNSSYSAIPTVKSVCHGTASLPNLGTRIWNLVPDKVKQLVDTHGFKRETKKWKPKNCLCRLCKTYVKRNVGFIYSFQFVLVFATQSGAVHQKHSHGRFFSGGVQQVYGRLLWYGFPLVHLLCVFVCVCVYFFWP